MVFRFRSIYLKSQVLNVPKSCDIDHSCSQKLSGKSHQITWTCLENPKIYETKIFAE